MNDTTLIMERLDRIEAQLTPLTASAWAIRDLRDEMGPRVNELVNALIVELADVESDFQLENLLERTADLPGRIDLDQAEPFSAGDLLTVFKDRDMRRGLGVALELTKSLGALKN